MNMNAGPRDPELQSRSRRRRPGQYPTSVCVPVTDEMRGRLEDADLRFGVGIAAVVRGCIEHGLEAALEARRERSV